MDARGAIGIDFGLVVALALGGAASGAERSPFDVAAALWHMGSPDDSAGKDSRLAVRGDVKLGIPLEGAEREASHLRGGDGYVARFEGGWLDAGQGAESELDVTGRAMTIALRVRDPSGAWGCPLLGKGSGPTREAFIISSGFSGGAGGGVPVLGAEIGSDEVAGMHRVETAIAGIGPADWHDLVVRFDGKTLQLIADGSLRDEEVAVGTLRGGNRQPFLIGAESFPLSGKASPAEDAVGSPNPPPSRRPDIVFEDFEGGTYERWSVEGEAFRRRPSKAGEIFHHQPLRGWEGSYLADSFLDSGDRATGKLISRPFTIERRYVNFLIGGGRHPGRTCLDLLVDGRAVRSETGDDSEILVAKRWDVGDLEGKSARLAIMDAESGGWGHILVDRIALTDDEVKAGFRGLIDHVALWDRALSDGEIAKLCGVDRLGDGRPRYYGERYRPQFHFTARKHWINDPNGLFFHEGTYHLCYQHMPPGRPGAYKDWGHAVSADLVHWKQLPSAVTPHKVWGGCWSGSAVVDGENTGGFRRGEKDPIVAILTNGGTPSEGPPCTQCLAVSVDGGWTFAYHEGNPVLEHIVAENRDPKVVWHGPTRKWVMALFLDGNDYGLFASPDLKSWGRLGIVNLPGVSECPDLFPLPADGDPGKIKWVFWGANGNHRIGSFDGRTFRPEGEVLRADWGANFYAAQSWSGIPESDGRRIQIAWMAGGDYPGMPFTQQMNFPTEVTLRTTPEGIRMFRVPVRELESLHEKERRWADLTVRPGENPFSGIAGELFELRADIEPGVAAACGIKVRGETIRYDVPGKAISCLGRSAPLALRDGRLRLQVLVDRTSLEVFAGDGRIVLTSCFLPPEGNRDLELFAEGGTIRISSAQVFSLRSIWD